MHIAVQGGHFGREATAQEIGRPPDSCHGNAYGALVAWVALLIIVTVSGFDFRRAQPSDFRPPEAGAILPTFA